MYNESVYRSIYRFSEEDGIQHLNDLMVEECAFGIFVNGALCDRIVCESCGDRHGHGDG